MRDTSIPISTYRLQLNYEFTFRHVQEIVPFLHKLGITHLYLSPILKARPKSKHGYDIVDHSQINPEIGTEEDFKSLVEELRKLDMGVIVDIVPNHMCIVGEDNHWWQDILENGPSSFYAQFFDIDWKPPREELVNKVLLPLLDSQFGEALESHSVKVIYKQGAFFIQLSNITFPTDPHSWDLILDPISKLMEKTFSEDNESLLELLSIITAIKHLPLTVEKEKEKIEERYREKNVIKRRLSKLVREKEIFAKLLQQYLDNLNGKKEEPETFDLLEKFLKRQPYRLSLWRVANDEINYRRFFDIFEYAGLKTENPQAFDKIHALIFDLIQKGYIDGLRIDHIDGLWDPEQYLLDLQSHCLQANVNASDDRYRTDLFYIIAEKILSGKEKLSEKWLLQGTVGYDFLNLVNGLFVAQNNRTAIYEIYRSFTDTNVSAFELIYFCKKLVLLVSLSSELHVLSRYLDRISQQHRSSRDFTAESLRFALSDVIACFPVYRTYIRANAGKIHKDDEDYINAAIARAKRMNPAISASIFEFIQKVLLMEDPPGISDSQRESRRNFVMRFQQLTGPVMAKGLEDTAFYRFYPLVSLNEVGTDPYTFGTSVENFHKKNAERNEFWPYSMLATSTHDTKRSEDVRARINVLSEIPNDWSAALLRWNKLNQKFKSMEGEESVPDTNEEYLLYQTLVGTWPLHSMDLSESIKYMERILAYMEKAIKEAKVHTSWINPNERHDKAVKDFILKLFSTNGIEFINELQDFVPKISVCGMLNSLSQLVLKLTSPGVPDIYQGNELWNFSLVDPDNRRLVDFSNRKYLLQIIQEPLQKDGKFCENLMKNIDNGLLKLYVTNELLRLRKEMHPFFQDSSYIPLVVQGVRENHIVAFMRQSEGKSWLTIVGRFFSSLVEKESPYVSKNVWENTYIIIPEDLKDKTFENVLTKKECVSKEMDGEIRLPIDELFDPFPFSVLLA